MLISQNSVETGFEAEMFYRKIIFKNVADYSPLYKKGTDL